MTLCLGIAFFDPFGLDLCDSSVHFLLCRFQCPDRDWPREAASTLHLTSGVLAPQTCPGHTLRLLASVRGRRRTEGPLRAVRCGGRRPPGLDLLAVGGASRLPQSAPWGANPAAVTGAATRWRSCHIAVLSRPLQAQAPSHRLRCPTACTVPPPAFCSPSLFPLPPPGRDA